MNVSGKWLVRAGALLVLLGYVLPTMTVSCGGFMPIGQSFSLAELASQSNQPLLYLVPAGILATGILAFLPPENNSRKMQFFWGQVVGLVVSLISIIVAGLSLYSQISQYGVFDINLEIGGIVLLIGYVLILVGIVMQRGEKDVDVYVPAYSSLSQKIRAPNISQQPISDIPPQEVLQSRPRLEVIQGNSPLRVIFLEGDDFTIGRKSENDLQLSNTNVSRLHARLRFAQGAWFLQDQESSTGTYINGQLVQAKRLNSSDEIIIGDTKLIFKL